jgi:succinyl-CoA synthetase alpha subunit
MKVLQLVEIGNLRFLSKFISFIYFSYPGTTFTDHIYRYENDPEAKIIVLLGEVCFFIHKSSIQIIISNRLVELKNIISVMRLNLNE